MARSLRVATTSLISGAVVVGNRGLGVLGSEVPSTGTHGPGYLYNDLTFPADANKEVRGVILTVPSSGTFFAYEDSSFSLIGAADGSYTFTYALYVDGAYVGDATGYITLGAGATATATITESGDTLSATATASLVANSAKTEANDTLAATTTSANALNLSVAEANDTSAATATASLAAASAITEAPDAVAATANATLAATATPTEADDTLAGTILTTPTATLAVTEQGDAASASSTAALFASLGITEADDLLGSTAFMAGGATYPDRATVLVGIMYGPTGVEYTGSLVCAGGLTPAQDDRLTRIEKFLRNKRVTDPATGQQTVYDDDGSTVLGQGALFEDAAGSQAYRGQGAERAERLA